MYKNRLIFSACFFFTNILFIFSGMSDSSAEIDIFHQQIIDTVVNLLGVTDICRFFHYFISTFLDLVQSYINVRSSLTFYQRVKNRSNRTLVLSLFQAESKNKELLCFLFAFY